MLPRRETHWNLQGCLKLANRCQPVVGRSSPYYEDMWRTYCCLPGFSDCQYVPELQRYGPTKLRDGAEMAIFCILYLQRAACSTFQTCILNSNYGHTMCRSMVDIQSATAEIRWGRKDRLAPLLHRAAIITSGQSNLTKDRIAAAADGSIVFARWYQCALPCGHIGAILWIRLNLCLLRLSRVQTQTANQSVKLFLHSSGPKVSVPYDGHPFHPKLPLSMGDLDSNRIHDSLGPFDPTTQTSCTTHR